MQSLVLTAVKTPLELQEQSDLVPGSGDVVVRLKAAALNRRDYWITQGMYPGIEPPVVLGSDGAGVVQSVGDGVSEDWLGTEVVINPGIAWGPHAAAQSDEFHILGLPTNGTFASEVVVPVEQLHAKPQHMSWHQAAALPLAGVTAWRATFTQGRLEPGETVLITGIGGGVATFALQYAVAIGADVWVTSSSQDKIDRAVALGAKGGFDYRDDDWTDQYRAQASAANLVIDSAGGGGYTALLELAATGGRIVNYGATTGPPEKLDLFKVFWKQLTLQGTTMGSPADFAGMLAFMTEHALAPIIDAVRPLEEGPAAVAEMKTSPQFGKTVLEIST